MLIIVPPNVFARALGLWPYEDVLSDDERREEADHLLKTLSGISIDDSRDSLCHFAAHYLPDLVHEWRCKVTDVGIHSALSDVLGMVALTSHFLCFFHSNHPEAKGIALHQAELLCGVDGAEEALPSGLPDACQFLWILLMWEDTDLPLPTGIVAQLCPKLEMWIERYNLDIAARLLGVLRKESWPTQLQSTIHARLVGNYDLCALPSCGAAPAPGSPTWEICWCGMVGYCSLDHWNAHWLEHRYMCCTPVWLGK